MNGKPPEGHRAYVAALRRMTFEQRYRTTMDLSERARAMLREGLQQRFPYRTAEQLHTLYLQRINTCHNSNY